MRIAKICQAAGASIVVYTMSWDGPVPDGFDVRIVSVRGFSNHSRAANFAKLVREMIKKEPVSLVVGFNKMLGLDVYYASDVCYAARTASRNVLLRLTPRCWRYLAMERAVFDKESSTHALLISPKQVEEFQKYYSLDQGRFTLLPPGLDKNFRPPENRQEVRKLLRSEFGLSDNDFLLLQVGSAFKTKGVDRVIRAVASLPESLKQRCVYVMVGDGKQSGYNRLAAVLGVGEKVIFAGVRQDISSLMAAADILVHPGRIENTGLTLLESIASSLPVICSGVCGYASYIADSSAGVVLDEPFDQDQLNTALQGMLEPSVLQQHKKTIVSYRSQTNLCGLSDKAAECIMERLV